MMKELVLDAEQGASLPERNEIEAKYTWDLSTLYSSAEEWEKSFNKISAIISDYSEFKGQLLSSTDALLDLLQFDEKVSIELDKLHLYAMLAKDVDLRDNTTQSLYDRISALASNAAAVSSYIRPELLSMNDEQFNKILSDERFSLYKHFFENLLRNKTSHTFRRD